jgi:hypothetical protein
MDIPATARALAERIIDDNEWPYDSDGKPHRPLSDVAPLIESALRAAQAAALREAAEAINNDTRAYGDYWREEVADWLRDRASRLAEGKG